MSLKIFSDKVIAYTLAAPATIEMEKAVLAKVLTAENPSQLVSRLSALTNLWHGGTPEAPYLAPQGRVDLLAGLRPEAPLTDADVEAAIAEIEAEEEDDDIDDNDGDERY